MIKKKYNKIPRHLAIIMDGNRRWARRKGLPASFGHRKGYEVFQKISQACLDRGIKIFTVYAFSTENWKRSKSEISMLMGLLEEALKREAERLHQKNICLKILGKVEDLPKSLQKIIKEVTNKTKNNKKGILNLAISYGGRNEITEAVKKVVKEGIKPEKITEKTFTNYLYTNGQPDPDLVIRTGGVSRLSNFLLWQSAYTEFYFTNVLWPDFTDHDLDKALDSYKKAERKFGE